MKSILYFDLFSEIFESKQLIFAAARFRTKFFKASFSSLKRPSRTRSIIGSKASLETWRLQ
jgi:hypothetical protein